MPKGRPAQHAELPGANAPKPGEHPPPAPDAPYGEQEPEGPAAAAAPAAADPPATPEPPAEPEKPEPPEDPRLAIGRRARERRAAELAEAGQDPQVKVLDTYAGAQHEPPAEPTPNAQPTDSDTSKGVKDVPPSGGDTDPTVQGIKISVYGEEVVVSEDDVRSAGIATLQKERAAEYRLSEAAKA